MPFRLRMLDRFIRPLSRLVVSVFDQAKPHACESLAEKVYALGGAVDWPYHISWTCLPYLVSVKGWAVWPPPSYFHFVILHVLTNCRRLSGLAADHHWIFVICIYVHLPHETWPIINKTCSHRRHRPFINSFDLWSPRSRSRSLHWRLFNQIKKNFQSWGLRLGV